MQVIGLYVLRYLVLERKMVILYRQTKQGRRVDVAVARYPILKVWEGEVQLTKTNKFPCPSFDFC